MKFEDDGGTPAWRARREPIYDPKAFRAKRQTSPFVHVLVLIVFFGGILPIVLFFSAPALAAFWDWVF